MMPHSYENFYKIIVQKIRDFEQENPSLPFSAIAQIEKSFNENPQTNWIKWIVTSNNDLSRHCKDNCSSDVVKRFHHLLAELLISQETSLTAPQLKAENIFVRDCILFKKYRFYSFPLIRKNAMRIENLAMYKTLNEANHSLRREAIGSSLAARRAG